MRRAWLLIAGAEAPYFLANRVRFKKSPPTITGKRGRTFKQI